MDQFSLTPFDERYLSVPYEWMEYKFFRFMNNPGYEIIRDIYLKNKTERIEKERSDKLTEESLSILEDSTYTKEEQDKILQAFKDAK